MDVDAVVVTVETDEVETSEADVVFCVAIDVVFYIDINTICIYVCEILLLSMATWLFVRVEAVVIVLQLIVACTG